MIQSKNIGEKIAEARKKANISQAQLAERISISPQAVGKWERGESMPDIITFSRLAEILGVDLNYFSDNFPSIEKETAPKTIKKEEGIISKLKTNLGLNWDMSAGNWVDADFSGLKNLKDKFSGSNIKNCKFLNSELSDLILKGNNIENSDFSDSDLRNSKMLASNISKNTFANCSFIDAYFEASEIYHCHFANANFSGAEFRTSDFRNNHVENAIWNMTSFKDSSFSEMIFGGTTENCAFENCGFSKVKFQNATLINTFFKHNRKFKNVEFIDCKADPITYAFLKSNQANLSGITILNA